jgi:hypothetical protein
MIRYDINLPFVGDWYVAGLQAGTLFMGKLFSRICQLVAEGRYVVGLHATERLDERGILEWQVVAGLADGELIRERPKSQPNPSVEVRETLPEGTEVMAVWAFLAGSNAAKLVTVHFFDRD